MARGGKSGSSASSGTRKKHARRAAGPDSLDNIAEGSAKQGKSRAEKGSKKKNKNEPRVKAYIPPVKPAPVQPDPLDTMGLARMLPPDLLVVLRKLGKKNALTKIGALEELQAGWVGKHDKDEELVNTLGLMLPVWLHHIPAMFVHPNRRIRLLAIGLHSSFLNVPAVYEQISSFLRDTASDYQAGSILGTWCMVSHDIDRQISTSASRTWREFISATTSEATPEKMNIILDDQLMPHVISFIQRAILDPVGLYTDLNPAPPVVELPPTRRVPGKPLAPPPNRRDTDEQNSRSKAEEEEENEGDRKARLRVSGMGTIRWILESRAGVTPSPSIDDLIPLLSNPMLWTALYHAQHAPYAPEVESIGFNQPNVRKAGWLVLQTLLQSWKDTMEPMQLIISCAVLRSAWVEPDTLVRGTMWQPLLTFLKDFPQAWALEMNSSHNPKDAGDSDEDDNASDEEPHETPVPEDEVAEVAIKGSTSAAYEEFLQFLELGCSGSPVQGYPTIVIILSTLSSTILASGPAKRSESESPSSVFFESFWAAVDGRALNGLDRAAANAAFLSSILECLLFLTKRIRTNTIAGSGLLGIGPLELEMDIADVEEGTKKLVGEQVKRLWDGVLGVEGGLKITPQVLGDIVGQWLLKLWQSDPILYEAAWKPCSDAVRSAEVGPRRKDIPQTLKTLSIIFAGSPNQPQTDNFALVQSVILSTIEHSEDALNQATDEKVVTSGLDDLTNVVDEFVETVFANERFAERIDVLTLKSVYRILGLAPSFLILYLTKRNHEDRTLQVWNQVLAEASQHPETILSLSPILKAAQGKLLPVHLKSTAAQLDGLTNVMLAGALQGSATLAERSTLSQLLQSSDYFLSEANYHSLAGTLARELSAKVDLALRTDQVSLDVLDAIAGLVKTVCLNSKTIKVDDTTFETSTMPRVFVLGFVLPTEASDSASCTAIGRDLWSWWLANSPQDSKEQVLGRIRVLMKSLVSDTSIRPSSQDILSVVVAKHRSLGFEDVVGLFPTTHELSVMLSSLPSEPLHPSLAVIDALLVPASAPAPKAANPVFDGLGYSSYARVIVALLNYFSDNRHLARQNMWLLHHLFALSFYADDVLKVPTASSAVFGEVLNTSLHEITTKARQLATYILTSSSNESLLSRFYNVPSPAVENLPGFLSEIILGLDTVRESRIIRVILQHLLDSASKTEADQWIALARKIEQTAPLMSMAIVSSVTEHAPEPPRLDRYRNELAASIYGLPAKKANSEGLLLLRKLTATAPDPESDTIFLPQLRVINIMKTCQQWIASDEDIDEEVESAMTLIFSYLAPILQSAPGAHWDFMFDVIENNLENSSFTDSGSLVTLARTLKLTISIENLSSTNKSLKADWDGRRLPILTLVKDLVAVQLDDHDVSLPRSICREMALTLMQDLPGSLIDHNTLSKMCHLLTENSTDVQKMAYGILEKAAEKRTEQLVIEVGVDTEATVTADLPLELLELIQARLQDDRDTPSQQRTFGYLLAWMTTFDLFRDASLKVKSSYVDQLRSLDVMGTSFIPNILNLLDLYEGTIKPLKLDIWAVDEFYVQLSDPNHPLSLKLLAAHLYYRALLTVPSLVRTWVHDCKDRQLYTRVVTHTSQYFSPVIIRTELAHVKSPNILADLTDENMSIKVATVVNEVTATYLVDEHQLEITLRMPSDWPLHTIEIKDLKKVGVLENRWRAWVLGVQQTIWAHNGRIADGLMLFKKNVSLHFAGQVECAICYSIISVMDGSLPRKPCKTCKNRFHSGCLYKWFNTSHSSSCPLCRSDMV